MKWLAVGSAGIFMIGVLALIWFIPVSSSTDRDEEVRDMIPYDLTARLAKDESAVELSWSAVDADGITLVVQRSLTGDEGTWSDLAELEPGSTSYLDAELNGRTSSVYRLRAFDGKGGSGLTSTVSVEDGSP